jgi:hypothetical protein
MKRAPVDLRLLAALVQTRSDIRQALVVLAGGDAPETVVQARALLGGAADRLTATAKNRQNSRRRGNRLAGVTYSGGGRENGVTL